MPPATQADASDELCSLVCGGADLCILRVIAQRNSTQLLLCEDRAGASSKFVVVKRTEVASQQRTKKKIVGGGDSELHLCMTDDSIQQELWAVRRLQDRPHRNVVRFVDVGFLHDPNIKPSSIVLGMEYCNNGDLFALLEHQRDGRFQEALALRIFRQIAEAVNHLHTIGIAHRDISLENVLIDAQGQVKICDFGLCTATTARTRDCVGKLQYMAPEVVSREEYHPALADLWSSGIVLFVMLTGSPLFAIAAPSDPAWNALQRLGVQGIVKEWKLDDRISHSTVELLPSLLKIDPTQRLQSLTDMCSPT